jgi:hypothetical protein
MPICCRSACLRHACAAAIAATGVVACTNRKEPAKQTASGAAMTESTSTAGVSAGNRPRTVAPPADTPAAAQPDRARTATLAPPASAPRVAQNPTPATATHVVSRRGDSAAHRDSVAVANKTPSVPAPASAAPPPIPSRAFAVGERLTYDVHFGPFRVGQASMEVVGVERFRNRDAYHTRFLLRGGTAFYRVNDRYESWFDARTLESLRYAQQIDQGSYERERVFDIFPERRTFTEAGKPEEQPSVADPLDDGSFLYFLRTIPLEVGKTYEFNRYFRADRNPVRISVLRRERIRVPAGSFDAIVVRPTIKTTGIFSEGGRAEVWFADDSTRRMLQMNSRLSFGSLSLHLRRVE